MIRNEMDYISPEPVFKKTQFVEHLVRCNYLSKIGFEEWIFHPGMLFNALNKWWGDQGYRHRPHEGLDLCWYRTKDGEILRLDQSIVIPVMYNGKVIKVENDYLGTSIYVCHSIYNNHREQLFTVYGHIKPDDNICAGKLLKEGGLLGTIAETGKRKTETPPHVHISVAWISESLIYENLNWESISDPGVAILINPLEIINCHYSILDTI